MQVGVERGLRQGDRASSAGRGGGPGSLVEEDAGGSGPGRYGRADSASPASSTGEPPTMKTTSPFTYR
jgi:hypothetical protein